MPLLSPKQIHNVLAETALVRSQKNGEIESVTDLLNASGIDRREAINTLGELMRGADTSSVRLNATKIALEMHGDLNGGEVNSAPIVNIIIKDSQFQVNPILVPR